MPEKLSWVFEGVDKFSGPMGAMSTSVVKLAFGLNEATELLETFSHALEWVGDKGFEFGKEALAAVSFKESSLDALEAVLGTKKAAHEMFEKAEAFASVTPFNSQEILRAWTKLKGDFTSEEVPIVWQAVTDVASFQATAEGVRAVSESMTGDIIHLMAQPTAIFRSMKSMFEGSGNIINPTNFGEGLAKVLGTTPVRAMAQLQAGTVQSKDAVLALVAAMSTLGGGKVGASTIKETGTIKGLTMSVQKLTESLFMAMGGTAPSSIPGVAAYKSSIGNLVDYFNTANSTGQRVSKALESVFSSAMKAIFGDFAGAGGAERITTTMERILGWVESIDWEQTFGGIIHVLVSTGRVLWSIFSGFTSVIWPVIKAVGTLFGWVDQGDNLTSTLEQIGKVLGVLTAVSLVLTGALLLAFSPITIIVGGILAWIAAVKGLMDVDWGFAVEQLSGMFSAVGNWFAEKVGAFREWGLSIIYGIGDGITSGVGWVVEKISGAGSAIMAAFKAKLGISSPSTVFAEYGINTTEGYVQGVESGMPDVASAFDGLLPHAGGSTGAGASSSVTVTFGEGAFKIDARGGLDAETFARQLRELLPSALEPALERMAISAGVG